MIDHTTAEIIHAVLFICVCIWAALIGIYTTPKE
jgi:hypothetical protein